MRDQACPPRVLAISRDGAAILSNDLTSELQSVPFAKLRRWTRDKSIIRFEAEQPFDCWGPAFMRRRSRRTTTRGGKRLRRLAALSKGRATQPKVAASWWFSPAPKQLPEAPASLSEDESSSDDDLDAPSRRVRFEIDLRDDERARGGEVLRLLDDYSVYDLQSQRPRCQYHSIFGTGLPSAGAARVAKATVGTPEALATEGGGALGDRPTVYNALVSAVIRPPRFLYDCRILGPSSFEFQNKRCLRHDLVLRNARGFRLHCSHWRFTDDTKRPLRGLHARELGI